MILLLIFSVFANAQIMWVDQNGYALYETKEYCEKYSKGVACYETDENFDKATYILVDEKFVVSKPLEDAKKAALEQKAADDLAKKQQIEALKLKLKSKSIKLEELAVLVEYLMERL